MYILEAKQLNLIEKIHNIFLVVLIILIFIIK